MAHYAFLNENNIVTEVIVGIDETDLTHDWETFYGELRNQVCKRTSYNNKIRGTYAAVGYSYNADEDIFIAPQPYPSWHRVGSFWDAPVAYPTDGKMYNWHEDLGAWVEAETV
jgi:hypothetical protein